MAWPSQADADAGMLLIASRHQLRPRLWLPLGAIGVVVAQYQLPDTRAALALRDQWRAEQPGWVTDLNARAWLQQSSGHTAPPRFYALAQLELGAPGAQEVASAAAIKLGVVDAALDPALSLNVSVRKLRSVLVPGDVPAAIEHGNEVALLLAGAAQPNGFGGAAQGVQLYWAAAMRQAGPRASTHTLHIAAALDWLLAQGVHIVNLSLGGAGDAVLQAVFARLVARPVLLVAAAGNGGRAAPPVYPAAYPGVLAVTAVDAAGQVYWQANRGAFVWLAAPGVDLWVPQRPGAAGAVPGSGGYLSGTSYAAALATATVVRADAAWWQWPKPRQIESLCRAARDLGEAGRDAVFGCGLVQAVGEARLRELP